VGWQRSNRGADRDVEGGWGEMMETLRQGRVLQVEERCASACIRRHPAFALAPVRERERERPQAFALDPVGGASCKCVKAALPPPGFST